MCAAMVQLYRMYNLYCLLLRVSSDLFALYFYYIAVPTEILRSLDSAPLQLQRNWCQPPLPTACRSSRANGGAPVPAPMVALPFRRLLSSVRRTPVLPMPHSFHLSYPAFPGSWSTPTHRSLCPPLLQLLPPLFPRRRRRSTTSTMT